MSKITNYLYQTNISDKELGISLLIFRILLSLSLINTHGLKKIVHFENTVVHIPDPFGLGGEMSTYFAIFANVFCPVFIILGFMTRLALLPIMMTTAIGFFVVHVADPWAVKDVPLMYLMTSTLLFVLGPGSISLDGKHSINQ